MIPDFNHSHVLPPFLGSTLSHTESSPYVVSASELIQRFGANQERRAILAGLLSYRDALRRLGFDQGFQWLDGSMEGFVAITAGVR